MLFQYAYPCLVSDRASCLSSTALADNLARESDKQLAEFDRQIEETTRKAIEYLELDP